MAGRIAQRGASCMPTWQAVRGAHEAMTAAARADRALFLAAVAAIGLVVTPLLHAEEHRREESGDAERIAEAWEAGSTTPLDALARALQHEHGEDTGEHPAAPPRHSHGPSAPGT